MMFDPEVTTVHTLNLRFTDGMDNYTDLDGLEWKDVRSMVVGGLEDRVYSGHPEVYNITIDGEPLTTVTYSVPGTYGFSIEGNYEYNTIGVQSVEFTLDKGQSAVTVDVPDDVAYDELPHGATVTVTAGDGDLTVTYIKVGTDVVLTEAPTEPGVYVVVVEVAETDYYYGYEGSFGPYEIYATTTGVEELTVSTQDNGAWYTIDGRRVVAPVERGIYIHNGKKYIVK